MQYEEWIDAFAGQIPKQNYQVELKNGDEKGLVITLLGKEYRVILDFGLTWGVQMYDEGVCLNFPEGYTHSPSFLKGQKEHLPSTLYKIENGEFSKRMKTLMGPEYFAAVQVQEYRIVTMNYEISVLSQCTPEIRVLKA